MNREENTSPLLSDLEVLDVAVDPGSDLGICRDRPLLPSRLCLPLRYIAIKGSFESEGTCLSKFHPHLVDQVVSLLFRGDHVIRQFIVRGIKRVPTEKMRRQLLTSL